MPPFAEGLLTHAIVFVVAVSVFDVGIAFIMRAVRESGASDAD